MSLSIQQHNAIFNEMLCNISRITDIKRAWNYVNHAGDNVQIPTFYLKHKKPNICKMRPDYFSWSWTSLPPEKAQIEMEKIVNRQNMLIDFLKLESTPYKIWTCLCDRNFIVVRDYEDTGNRIYFNGFQKFRKVQ